MLKCVPTRMLAVAYESSGHHLPQVSEQYAKCDGCMFGSYN